MFFLFLYLKLIKTPHVVRFSECRQCTVCLCALGLCFVNPCSLSSRVKAPGATLAACQRAMKLMLRGFAPVSHAGRLFGRLAVNEWPELSAHTCTRLQIFNSCDAGWIHDGRLTIFDTRRSLSSSTIESALRVDPCRWQKHTFLLAPCNISPCSAYFIFLLFWGFLCSATSPCKSFLTSPCENCSR